MSGIFGGLLGSLSGLVVQYLVVAGGGGGGDDWGGGGGAGGMITETITPLANESYSITIGAGGAGVAAPTAQGSNGVNSTAFSTAIGGGGGGGDNFSGGDLGRNGGSGGGGAIDGAGGLGTAGQGNAGAAGSRGANLRGGGGGGAGDVGSGRQGGVGRESSISGTNTYYAGGGSAGANDAVITPGGLGGGGAGHRDGSATAGTANRGGGGGASNSGGKAGGSGIVIFKYPSQAGLSFSAGISGTTSLVGAERVTTITAGTGTFTFKTQNTLASALNESSYTGLIGQYFTGNYVLTTGDVGTLPLSAPTNYSSISYPTRADNYGFIAIGYFKPPTTGTYTFFTSSDDGSGVWVGSLASAATGRTGANAVLNNNMDGGQANTKRSGTISLTAGEWYPIRIVHEDGGGGDNLTFSWSGPGIAETTSLSTYFKRPVNLEVLPINTFYELT